MSKKSEELFEKQLDKIIAETESYIKANIGTIPDLNYMYHSGEIAGLYAAKFALAASKLGVLK